MNFAAEWKKAFESLFSPLPLIALGMTLGLNAAAYIITSDSFRIALLVFAGLSASTFGGLLTRRFTSQPSALAIRSGCARSMISIVRDIIDKRHTNMPLADAVLELAETQLPDVHKDKIHE